MQKVSFFHISLAVKLILVSWIEEPNPPPPNIAKTAQDAPWLMGSNREIISMDQIFIEFK